MKNTYIAISSIDKLPTPHQIFYTRQKTRTHKTDTVVLTTEITHTITLMASSIKESRKFLSIPGTEVAIINHQRKVGPVSVKLKSGKSPRIITTTTTITTADNVVYEAMDWDKVLGFARTIDKGILRYTGIDVHERARFPAGCVKRMLKGKLIYYAILAEEQ